MPAPTATINGVTLTEAQVAEASAQIERAKQRTQCREVRVSREGHMLYLSPALVRDIADIAQREPDRYVVLNLQCLGMCDSTGTVGEYNHLPLLTKVRR